MNLIGRVLLMTVCVFTAYALPNLGHLGAVEENAILKSVISQLENALINPKAANNTQNSCFAAYLNRIDQINAQTVNQTQACSESSNRALSSFNANINQTLNSVNAQSRELQGRLANCSNRNSSEAVFNCNVAAFEQNLANLANLTSQSQLATASTSGYQYQVDVAQQSCVGVVLTGNRSNSTAASIDLEVCLGNSTIGSSNSTNPGNRTMTYYLN